MLSVRLRLQRRLVQQRAFSVSSCCHTDVRPPTAPKQIPDIKSIRSSPELYEQNAILRNYAQHKDSPKRIAGLAELSSKIAKSALEPRRALKALEQELGVAKRQKNVDAVQKLLAQIAPLRQQCNTKEAEKNAIDEQIHSLALAQPNLTSSHTPQDGEARVITYLNFDEANPVSSSPTTSHSVIGQDLGIIDFTSAATTTGWGFYYLLNEGALLEHALVQYALSVAMRKGWRIVTPPSVVYSHIADSCGFQPRDIHDEQQIWQIAQADKDVGKPKRSLTATAEIPLAALYANKDIHEAELPVKLVGSGRCYRAEAGARGVDTKGLYRVHEFTKVEMFAWTDASVSSGDDSHLKYSTVVFDEMVEIQKEILSSLGLPCRVLEMPSTDLGASAYRKIDIEAIFPSRMQRDGGWGELSSVSICTDYQSRRLDTRIKEAAGGRSRFPHTLNGTALAVPRVLAAILEHGWSEAERHVTIPEVLVPFTGFNKIGPK